MPFSTCLPVPRHRGKIRHYGISCTKRATPEQAVGYLDHPDVSVLQTPIGFLNHRAFEEILPTATEKDVGLMARAPFGEGALFRSPELLDAIGKLVDAPPAQTVIRFALQLNPAGVVLIGANRREHLDEDLAALGRPPLPSEVVEAIRTLALQQGTA